MNRNRVDDFIKKKLLENRVYIKSIAEDLLDDLQKRIINATSSGKGFKEITQEISERYDVSIGRAKTLARTETAKINSAATEARVRDLGVTSYIWRSAFLPTSRESHMEMDGQQVDYDNPPTLDGMTGHAGEFPNCYCWENPVILKESEDPVLEIEDNESDRTESGGIDSGTRSEINKGSIG